MLPLKRSFRVPERPTEPSDGDQVKLHRGGVDVPLPLEEDRRLGLIRNHHHRVCLGRGIREAWSRQQDESFGFILTTILGIVGAFVALG